MSSNELKIHAVARSALNEILPTSIRRRKEYGGMIYQLRGDFFAMPPRTQDEPTTVDVGTHEPNCGCPENSKPVAYYHTHVVVSQAGFKGDYNKFSDDDQGVQGDIPVAKANNIDAYLGTLDGSFFWYSRASGKQLRLKGQLKNTEDPR